MRLRKRRIQIEEETQEKTLRTPPDSVWPQAWLGPSTRSGQISQEEGLAPLPGGTLIPEGWVADRDHPQYCIWGSLQWNHLSFGRDMKNLISEDVGHVTGCQGRARMVTEDREPGRSKTWGKRRKTRHCMQRGAQDGTEGIAVLGQPSSLNWLLTSPQKLQRPKTITRDTRTAAIRREETRTTRPKPSRTAKANTT